MLKHKGTQKICTKRLALRPFRLDDAQSMYKNYASDARVTRFLSWQPYTDAEQVRQFLRSVIGSYDDNTQYHWAIEFEGEVIGSISTISIDEKNQSCELGYCLGYAWWNKGITGEVAQAVVRFLFEEVGMHRIMAKHDVENPASGKVMQKCGMTPEGMLRKHYRRHDGSYSDAQIYGILKEEFEP